LKKLFSVFSNDNFLKIEFSSDSFFTIWFNIVLFCLKNYNLKHTFKCHTSHFQDTYKSWSNYNWFSNLYEIDYVPFTLVRNKNKRYCLYIYIYIYIYRLILLILLLHLHGSYFTKMSSTWPLYYQRVYVFWMTKLPPRRDSHVFRIYLIFAPNPILPMIVYI